MLGFCVLAANGGQGMAPKTANPKGGKRKSGGMNSEEKKKRAKELREANQEHQNALQRMRWELGEGKGCRKPLEQQKTIDSIPDRLSTHFGNRACTYSALLFCGSIRFVGVVAGCGRYHMNLTRPDLKAKFKTCSQVKKKKCLKEYHRSGGCFVLLMQNLPGRAINHQAPRSSLRCFSLGIAVSAFHSVEVFFLSLPLLVLKG